MAQPHNIVILTGSGISAESGMKTFRASDGLWEEHRIEDVATPEGFQRNPELVQRFYNQRRAQLKTVEPNAAHLALAQLEKDYAGRVLVITQNVDDLHERAGTKQLLHMHGELKKVRCIRTEEVTGWHQEITPQTPCPCCQKAGTLRPHIVWFGEIPLYMDAIDAALSDATLFISIGTSGTVYPAAGFVQQVRYGGQCHTIEINLEPSAGHSLFAEQHYGKATELVPLFVTRILSGKYDHL